MRCLSADPGATNGLKKLEPSHPQRIWFEFLVDGTTVMNVIGSSCGPSLVNQRPSAAATEAGEIPDEKDKRMIDEI
jgi:hypothetical protein